MRNSMKLLPMALLVLASCSNEDPAGGPQTAGNVIRASFEQSAALPRVVIDWNGESTSTPTLTWSAGDAFNLYNTGNSHSTYVTTTGGGTTATFAWDNNSTNPSGQTGTYAVFPSASVTSVYNGSLIMNLPATISDADTKCQLPMLGEAQNASEVSFKHLGGVLMLTIKDLPTTATSISVEADKAISGAFTATLSNESPVLVSTSTADADKKLTLEFTALKETASKTFYVPLPVNTYSSIKVKVGNVQIVNWENKTVNRAEIYAATLTYNVIDATTPTGVNNTLSNATMTEGETTTVNISSDFSLQEDKSPISVEQVESSEVSLNFATVPQGTTSENPLKIQSIENNQPVEDTDDAVNTIVIGVAAADNNDTEQGAHLELTGGKTTFMLEETTGSGNVNYENVTALTANNTLIIGSRVHIKNLTIKGGNVIVKGKVETLTLDNNTTTNSIKVFPGASVSTNNSGVEVTFVPGDNNGNEDYTDGGTIEW